MKALDASADQTMDELCTNGQHKVSELPLDLCLLRLVWVSNDWAVMTRSEPRKTWWQLLTISWLILKPYTSVFLRRWDCEWRKSQSGRFRPQRRSGHISHCCKEYFDFEKDSSSAKHLWSNDLILFIFFSQRTERKMSAAIRLPGPACSTY